MILILIIFGILLSIFTYIYFGTDLLTSDDIVYYADYIAKHDSFTGEIDINTIHNNISVNYTGDEEVGMTVDDSPPIYIYTNSVGRVIKVFKKGKTLKIDQEVKDLYVAAFPDL